MAGDHPTVLDLIGNTPLVRLQRLSREVEPTLLAKLEFLNPGGSVKDRIGLRMIEQAEREGKLAPGGTIVEPTSGNTGVGLAIAAALKGYRCVFVMPDKIAEEKRALLRAYGAEVVICPTAVPPESPESYYSVSNRLAEEIPGAFKPDQYSNQANPQAHYETTGPELWEQTGGKIDALVLSVGTGGTVTGTARYLKEQKPDLLVVGADPEGSIFSQPDNVHPYLVEGIGEDFWPTTFDPSLVDEFITVSDRDSFRIARRLAREEGILVGGSGGTAVWAMLQVAERFGPDATLVTLIPDSGRGYLSKVYDDNWLLEHGFLERAAPPRRFRRSFPSSRRRSSRCRSSSPSRRTRRSERRSTSCSGTASRRFRSSGTATRPRRSPTSSARSGRAGSSTGSSATRTLSRRTSPPRWSRRSPLSRSAPQWTPCSPTSPPETPRSWSRGAAGRSEC